MIGGGAVHFLNTREEGEQGNLAEPAPSQGEGEENATPEQPDWCPRVEFISAPGTWESAADDDPINPGANPNSFMLSITNPLKEAYVPEDVKVWTRPHLNVLGNVGLLQRIRNRQHEGVRVRPRVDRIIVRSGFPRSRRGDELHARAPIRLLGGCVFFALPLGGGGLRKVSLLSFLAGVEEVDRSPANHGEENMFSSP